MPWLFIYPGRETAKDFMSLESQLNSSPSVFLVQDKLFRVWGKVVLQRDTESICEGRFEALPDFRYLRGRFAEYQSLIGETGSNFFEIAAMNQWMAQLEPKLVSENGDEVRLISAYVEASRDDAEMVLYGLKLNQDDEALVAAALR